jgi:hypothetical protein
MTVTRAIVLVIPAFLVFAPTRNLLAQSHPIESATNSNSCASAFDCPRPLNEQFNLVRAVARALKSRGFEVGPVKGIYWGLLRDSVAKVQKSAGLEPTGNLDYRTVQVILGVDLRERSR